MGNSGEKTTMGGCQEGFLTTCWTEILQIRTTDTAFRQNQIGYLIQKYWKPVYCYLRKKGMANERAKDATQGFFHEIVLNRQLFDRADQQEGKFRTFLLTALDRYVADLYDKETAQKRSPEIPLVPLVAETITSWLQDKTTLLPEDAFEYAWACDVLDSVLLQVQREFEQSGKESHWMAFRDRIVTPILEGMEPPSLPEICRRYGFQGEDRASRILFHVKERFRLRMREYLRQFVESDAGVDREFEEILKILSNNAGRSV